MLWSTKCSVPYTINSYNLFKVFIMAGVTVSEVCNLEDKKVLTLYVVWIDSYFKIVLLCSTMEILYGEMNTEDVNSYSKELSKSSNEYLKDTRDIFLGHDPEVTFLLKNKIFTWKRGIWIQGRIVLHQMSDMATLVHMFGELLTLHKTAQEDLRNFSIKNDSLQKCNDRLKSELEDVIRMKQTMEKQLYQKFILLLNSKKERIRELEGLLNSNKKEEKSIFEINTDDSDMSDKDEKPLVNEDALKSEKRKVLCEDIQSDTRAVKKISMQTILNSENDSRSKASTSKDLSNECRQPRSLSDSSETDCELELKDVDDDETTKISSRRLSFSEESEEDLFAHM